MPYVDPDNKLFQHKPKGPHQHLHQTQIKPYHRKLKLKFVAKPNYIWRFNHERFTKLDASVFLFVLEVCFISFSLALPFKFKCTGARCCCLAHSLPMISPLSFLGQSPVERDERWTRADLKKKNYFFRNFKVRLVFWCW